MSILISTHPRGDSIGSGKLSEHAQVIEQWGAVHFQVRDYFKGDFEDDAGEVGCDVQSSEDSSASG